MGPLIAMEEFIVASWVIRAIWREIQRFVLEFKASLFFRDSYNLFDAFSLERLTYEFKETVH